VPFTGQEVIDEAREKHRAFTEQHSPTRAALAALNRFVRRLYFDAVEVNEDLFAATENFTFPLGSFAAGEALTEPSAMPLSGTINFTDSNRPGPLNFVPYRMRFTPGVGSAAYIRDGTIRFVGTAEDWQGVASVDYDYLPEPALGATEADPVPLPDPAKPACVDAVAKWMASRTDMATKQITVNTVQDMANDAALSRGTFLREIGRMRRAQENYVKEVW
jgi:hypothetical protein